MLCRNVTVSLMTTVIGGALRRDGSELEVVLLVRGNYWLGRPLHFVVFGVLRFFGDGSVLTLMIIKFKGACNCKLRLCGQLIVIESALCFGHLRWRLRCDLELGIWSIRLLRCWNNLRLLRVGTSINLRKLALCQLGLQVSYCRFLYIQLLHRYSLYARQWLVNHIELAGLFMGT